MHTRIQAPRGPIPQPDHAPQYEAMEEIWRVLAMGVRDFAHANGYQKAILGLSGGIDAAVAASVAVDALGAENVIGCTCLARPVEEDEHDRRRRAPRQAWGWSTCTDRWAVAPALEGAADQVGDIPSGDALDELYARARAALAHDGRGLRRDGAGHRQQVRALDRRRHPGGDMTGDFAPLRDCPKTLLYQLVRWRNQSEEDDDIPEEVWTARRRSAPARSSRCPPTASWTRSSSASSSWGRGWRRSRRRDSTECVSRTCWT